MSNDPIPQPDSSPEPVIPTPLPPVTPPTDAAPVPAVATTQLTDSGLMPNVAAGLAVLLTLITGLIFLFLEKRNQFVRFWAMQSVFFGAAWVVFVVVSGVIGATLAHIFWPLAILWHLFAALIYLGFLIVWIILLIQAFSGKEWELPYLGKLAREQLARMPVV